MADEDPYARHDRARAAALAGIATFTGLFLLWTARDWGGLLATRAFVDLATTGAALLAGGLALVRATHLPGERKVAWILLGLGSASWGLGNTAWTYLELWQQRHVPIAQRSIPFPSAADIGYVALLVFAVAALLVMIIGSTQATTRLRTFLDGLLIASAVLFAAWIVVLRPIIDFAGGQEGLATVLALAYPFGDLLLLSLLLLVASRVHPAVRRTMAWIGAALVALAVADIGFWYAISRGTYATGLWTDVGWSLAFLLIAYASVRPLPVVAEHDVPRPGLWLSALPLAPFVVSTGLAMVVQVREGALPPFLFWNAIIVVGTLAVRQFVMVYENLQLRRETEAALTSLQEAQAQRGQMLNNVTHDLLSPLSAVRIQLKLLAGDTLGPRTPRQERALSILDRNVDRVSRLSSDLKDLANLEGRRLGILVGDVDLAHEARRAVATFQEEARQRQVTLDLQAPPTAPLRGDEGRIGQVLDNLLSNALKFTPAGGRVTVHVEGGNPSWSVTVTDTGRGLAPEEAARLFRPFSQVHRPGEVKERGTGLGLYISRGIAERHGGTLDVSSPGLGHGATFRFDLPRAPPAEAPPGR